MPAVTMNVASEQRTAIELHRVGRAARKTSGLTMRPSSSAPPRLVSITAFVPG